MSGHDRDDLGAGDRIDDAAELDAGPPETEAEPAQLVAHGAEPVRMTEAEARFAARLAEDVEQVLGVGIAVSDLEIQGEGPVKIRAVLLADGAVQDIEGTGENSLDAYRALMRAAAELRLAKAFWRMVGDM
jgi:hypothetical protein